MALVGHPAVSSYGGALAHVPGASEALVMLLVLCHIPSETPLSSLAAPR